LQIWRPLTVLSIRYATSSSDRLPMGLRLCASRKGGTRGGGRVSTLGPSNMATLGLAVESPWSSPGGPAQVSWLLLGLAVESPWSSPGGPFLLMCTNGLRKRSSGHVGPPFLAVRLFSRSVGGPLAMSRDYCKLVRQWVWFESRMWTGWLHWHLCQVRSFKTHLKWKNGTLIKGIRRFKMTSTGKNLVVNRLRCSTKGSTRER